MLRLEVEAPSGEVDQLIEAIVKATRSSRAGDDWINVYSIEKRAPLCLFGNDRTPPLRAA
jgi:nitrogen regulatory protein PII